MSKCPRDSGTLVAQAAAIHDVLKCGSCEGLWLPKSAVFELVGKIKRPSPSNELVLASGLRCPDDASRLIPINRKGVEIDVCETCGGVWLEELQSL